MEFPPGQVRGGVRLQPELHRHPASHPGLCPADGGERRLQYPERQLHERLHPLTKIPAYSGAVLFLLNNEAASFITGVTLPIDGGFSAYSGV